MWAAGALSLWWDEQVTILGQVCVDHWCIVTVVGRAGHRTETGVWGLLVYCRCDWDEQVTILGQVCGGRWCIAAVVGRAGHCIGTGVWGSLVHCLCGGMCKTPYWDRCVGVAGALPLWWNVRVTVLVQVCLGATFSLWWDMQVTVLEQVCLGGTLSLWWDVQVTVLGQVCVGCWCIAAVVGRAGHCTGTGVQESLVHCHCGGTSRSPYWDRCVGGHWCIVAVVGQAGHCTGTCVGVAGALPLWWDEQVTVLEQVCQGCWCILTEVG